MHSRTTVRGLAGVPLHGRRPEVDRRLTVDGHTNPGRMTALVDALNASDCPPPSERFHWSPAP
jgi:hypothetical protein